MKEEANRYFSESNRSFDLELTGDVVRLLRDRIRNSPIWDFPVWKNKETAMHNLLDRFPVVVTDTSVQLVSLTRSQVSFINSIVGIHGSIDKDNLVENTRDKQAIWSINIALIQAGGRANSGFMKLLDSLDKDKPVKDS